ncbi:hypothetical protein OTU49_010517 [Cherax quadricarinatus]|uniref:Uncharacterized protein n=1 Tax=Cherax quadricarinatus TaxID=27406 RepID=A0AAW0WDS6_CHEQU|nr:torsin-1B-like [Cherax quadricarinatus]XP_053648576.1 torsin-1B-like [Cherax quadricarinatus]XP_053648577.1 torsin-1B-like [Cherax quadricarinatus]XP_053648578.1 torsin-1B-like [Cherax quadricarinatus]
MAAAAPLSSNSARHKPFRRSASAQPETLTMSLSPYSSRRKLRAKSPGRNLTAIFTAKGDSSGRLHSDDSSASRRKTSTSDFSNGLHLKTIKEVSSWNSLSRSSSAPHYNRHSETFPVNKPDDTEDSSTASDNDDYTNLTLSDEPDHYANKRVYPDLSNDSSLKLRSIPYKKKLRTDDNHNSQGLNEKQSVIHSLLKTFSKIIIFIIVLLFSLLFLTVGMTKFFVYQETKCEEKRNAMLPLNELKEQLSLFVVGQEIAIDVLISSLKKIVPNKSEKPLIFWMVGWTGSGKTHTTHIIKDILSETSYVHLVIPSLLPQDTSSLHKEMVKLFNRLDPCSLNVIIIDGWDEEGNFPIKVLENVIFHINHYKAEGYNIGQMVLILSGTRGSTEIGEYFLNLRQSGKSREEFKSEEFINVTTSLREAKLLRAVTQEFVLLPYLPLEVPHIKLCIKEELLKLQNTEVLLKEDKLKKITQKLLDQLNFLPASYPLVAVTGCKRVQPLLALLLSGPNPPSW